MKGNKGLIIFLVLAVLGISFTFYGYQILYTPNIQVGKEPREVTIPDSASFATVQKILEDGDYVQDLVSFSFIAKLMDYDKFIKPGRYLLQSNMNNVAAVRLLRSGKQVPVNITFNNIRTIDELAEKITRNLVMTAEQFKAELMRVADSNPEGFTRENIISIFIPNTYQVYYDLSPRELIDRMHVEYERFWNDGRKAKAKAIGFTPVEVSTLASIVQAETISKDEAPVIAGLYINRLKQGIPLQADPTLKFAIGDFAIKRVLNEHKEIQSPYNTYLNAGLPPGPINMPEILSLEAVLNYQVNDYLYMCAKEDFSGSHNFTSNYLEHVQNAKRYQTALTREEQIGRQQRLKSGK